MEYTENQVIEFLEQKGYDFIDGLDFNKDMFLTIANEWFTYDGNKQTWILD